MHVWVSRMIIVLSTGLRRRWLEYGLVARRSAWCKRTRIRSDYKLLEASFTYCNKFAKRRIMQLIKFRASLPEYPSLSIATKLDSFICQSIVVYSRFKQLGLINRKTQVCVTNCLTAVANAPLIYLPDMGSRLAVTGLTPAI
ncbi:hypothetical protein TcasGA2_TC013239 [Tribolium castaneum]|uniref:Uncharacterized protein n=1 Tax=Tribolium castaneum TaxID=7070 RepID=D6WMH0_TRICA|nr:hypothetical protein TcasGA2_TC013239 [Tribolium castaneum]